ncbi:MAG: copper amine oxidase N-terminal domain-containing protein [Clostridiales bacterium]|jgi:hypothetical protein|nr:copper amine oxidase N-terminal domain-containing protein [Clostridiales bacterium]
MKKILLTAIMIIIMATTAFGVAQFDENGNLIENEVLEGGIVPMIGGLDVVSFPAFGSATGEIIELWTNDASEAEFIRIRTALSGDLEDEFTETDFQLHFNTLIIGEMPQIGDTITGFFDNNVPMIMIYPAQHVAIALINRADDLPRIIVDRFNEDWVSSAEQFHLNIGDNTEIVYQNGDAFVGEIEELIGRILMVEFMISHRNFPETIPNPQKITILYERAVHPGIAIDWDLNEEFDVTFYDESIWENFEWSGDENADLNSYDIVITINGLSRGVPASHATVGDSVFPNYVPLRAVTEMLGYIPTWNAELREIVVNSPRGEITLRIDSPYYTLISPNEIISSFTLEPPIIINNFTYVPLAFFREVFGFNNVHFEGGNISLDNGEIVR